MKPEHWLISCTGNTCRSPMAQAVVQTLADRRGLPLVVASRGLAAYPGDGASPQAVEAAAEWGADLSAHRAQRLTVGDVEDADRIYVMSDAHKQAILSVCPEKANAIWVLQVADPYGQSVEVYRACLAQMERYFEPELDALEKRYENA